MSKMINNALSAALITSTAYITLPSNAIATSYLCEAELTSIDSANGSVKVYSNGADQGTWNSCKSENGIFGYEYQCTELADRYFNYNFPSTFGRDYFLNALNLGFAPLKNRESPIPPKHGDAIGFDNRTATDQDFFGGTYGDSAIIFNAWLNKAFIVRDAFWEFYRTHDGPIALGSPIENEHAPVPNQTHIHPCSSNALSCQGFQRGSLYWDGKSVIPISNPLLMFPINLQIQ